EFLCVHPSVGLAWSAADAESMLEIAEDRVYGLGTHRPEPPEQGQVRPLASSLRPDVDPQWSALDLDLDSARGGLALQDDLLEAVPPNLGALAHAPHRDEKGRRQACVGEDGARVVRVVQISV